jgi:hypothetical protein
MLPTDNNGLPKSGNFSRLLELTGGRVFGTIRDAERITGYTSDGVKYLMRTGKLQPGIHYVKPDKNSTRFNLPLLLDWVVNRGNEQAHQRAIELFASLLPSNQKRRAG